MTVRTEKTAEEFFDEARRDADAYEYLGNFSAAPPWLSVLMSCHACRVSWTGCWDNFQCPRCGEGELPSVQPIEAQQ